MNRLDVGLSLLGQAAQVHFSHNGPVAVGDWAAASRSGRPDRRCAGAMRAWNSVRHQLRPPARLLRVQLVEGDTQPTEVRDGDDDEHLDDFTRSRLIIRLVQSPPPWLNNCHNDVWSNDPITSPERGAVDRPRPMPRFTLAALETSIGKRVALPAYEIRSIAAEIYEQHERGGPAGATWHPQRVMLIQGSREGYELCRSEWSGGVYFSRDAAQVQSLADALNELEDDRSKVRGSGNDSA
jgi:hypothetical protein